MDDRRYQRCLAIKELVDSALFEEAVNGVIADVSREILTSQPQDAQTRESLFYEHLALGRLLGRLNIIANDARNVAAQVEKARQHATH